MICASSLHLGRALQAILKNFTWLRLHCGQPAALQSSSALLMRSVGFWALPALPAHLILHHRWQLSSNLVAGPK